MPLLLLLSGLLLLLSLEKLSMLRLRPLLLQGSSAQVLLSLRRQLLLPQQLAAPCCCCCCCSNTACSFRSVGSREVTALPPAQCGREAAAVAAALADAAAAEGIGPVVWELLLALLPCCCIAAAETGVCSLAPSVLKEA